MTVIVNPQDERWCLGIEEWKNVELTEDELIINSVLHLKLDDILEIRVR